MRPELLNHPQYTHLLISPDDLLIDDNNKLELLLKDYESFPSDKRDKIIMSGYCNVDTSENSKYANVTQFTVPTKRQERISYKWYTLDDLQQKSFQENPLIKVAFSGFPLIVIPRLAMEQIEFRNDSFTGKFDSNGCCVDVMFCNDAIEKGFEIYVDTRVRFEHLKFSDQYTSEMLQRHPKFEKDYIYYYEYKK
jgi:hypothetical protein